jgi:hypothetical protein
VDYLALLGDASDNVPGVRGIGAKTAHALIERWGSLENMLDHLTEVEPTRARSALHEHAADGILSKQLVTIRTDLPMQLDLEELTVREPNWSRPRDLFVTLEFRLPAQDAATRGWIALRARNLDEAMRRFNQAWLIDPNSGQALWGMGAVQGLAGKTPESLDLFREAEPLMGDDIDFANRDRFRRCGGFERDGRRCGCCRRSGNRLLAENRVLDAAENAHIVSPAIRPVGGSSGLMTYTRRNGFWGASLFPTIVKSMRSVRFAG